MMNGERNKADEGHSRRYYPTRSIKVLSEVGYLKMFIYLFMAAFRILGVPDGFLSAVPKAVDRQRVVINIDDEDEDEWDWRRYDSSRRSGSPHIKQEAQGSRSRSSQSTGSLPAVPNDDEDEGSNESKQDPQGRSPATSSDDEGGGSNESKQDPQGRSPHRRRTPRRAPKETPAITCPEEIQMHAFMALMEKVSEEVQERILQRARAGDLKHAWNIAITFFWTNTERDRSLIFSRFFKITQEPNQSFATFASRVQASFTEINNLGEPDLVITEKVKLLQLKAGMLESTYGKDYEMIITIIESRSVMSFDDAVTRVTPVANRLEQYALVEKVAAASERKAQTTHGGSKSGYVMGRIPTNVHCRNFAAGRCNREKCRFIHAPSKAPKKGTAKPKRTCFVCGSEDHISTTCPKIYDAGSSDSETVNTASIQIEGQSPSNSSLRKARRERRIALNAVLEERQNTRRLEYA
jgi:hypothetical protein